jgi:hypothetical protein
VDKADNTKILWESATFTADQDGTDSGWINLPVAFTSGEATIEWQAKSTVAGDDPVARGFRVYLK